MNQYPAHQVLPGWQVYIAKTKKWLSVGFVIETEATDGSGHILLGFEEELPAIWLDKVAMIPARPPSQLPYPHLQD